MQNLNSPRTLFSLKVIGLCLLALSLVFFCSPGRTAYAVTSAEKYAEAEEILQRIDVLQTELNEVQANYDTALEDHEKATVAMDAAQERVLAAEARVAELQLQLSGRVNSMYKTGSVSFLDVILEAASFDEFLTSWDMLERINTQDAELVQETKDVRQEAEEARQEYQAQKELAASKMKQAEDLMSEIEAKQGELRVEAQSISEEAAQLEAEEIAAAEAATQAAEEAARAAAAASNTSYVDPGRTSPSGSGILTHPLPGSYVSSSFGYRIHPIQGYSKLHAGVDFAASSGTTYYAAGSGTVSMAAYGYNGGAGNMIVISHGNGMVTRYFHSSELFVSVGDQVSAGQAIGSVGSTGSSTGPHLHFEVKINDVAVDPMLYI